MSAAQQQEGAASAVGRDFVTQMPGAVSGQRALLESLLAVVEVQDAFCWVEMTGSLARGAGDELSDIDAGLGIADDQWPEAIETAARAVRELAPAADGFRQRFDGQAGQDCWHLVTLYESGLQLSLVVMPASWRPGLPPQSVALYDATGQLARTWQPDTASPAPGAVREWACLGWMALGDLAKYAERGSLWEARERLEQARGFVWQLWALAAGAIYPAFGLTSVLDTPGCELPDGIDATIAGLDRADLLTAADALAGQLDRAAGRAVQAVEFAPPAGLRSWTRSRLTAVRASLPPAPGRPLPPPKVSPGEGP